MTRLNPRLFYWLAALYDHPRLITSARRDVLLALAVKRLDYGTGAGYCSVRTLAGDTGLSEATVKRALDAARKTEPVLLERTKRGHRLGDGKVIASEWQIIYPISTAHGRTLEVNLNSSHPGSQQRTRDGPTGSEAPTGGEADQGVRAVDLHQARPAMQLSRSP
jgi:hypothetical protein